MLSIDAKGGSGAGAAGDIADYVADQQSLESYYSGERERRVASQWFGAGAAALALKGPVARAELLNLLQGRSPHGEQLVKRPAPRLIKAGDAQIDAWLQKHHQTDGQRASREWIDAAHGALDRMSKQRYGWDLTFSAPKSVSVLAAVDPAAKAAIEAAHDAAVRDALSMVEENWAVGERGNHAQREYEREHVQIVAALYRHDTSRDLDPQLHSHVLLMNAARRADGSWGAIQSHEIYRNQKAIGALYRASLAAGLKDLGYRIERDGGSFRIAGVPSAAEEAFSQRKQEIENYLLRKYRIAALKEASPKQIKEAVLATRPQKQSVDEQALLEDWRAQAAEAGLTADQAAALRANRPERQPVHEAGWRESVREALFEHQSVAREHHIWEQASIAAQGLLRPHQVAAHVEHIKESLKHIVSLQGAREAWTTPELFKAERDIIASAERRMAERSSKLSPQTLDAAFARFKRERGFALSAEQQAFCRSLGQQAGGIRVGVGRAGTGKSASMDALRIGYESEGYRVAGLALAGKAAAELHRSAHVEDTSTIHRFLLDLEPREACRADGSVEKSLPPRRQLSAKDVLIVDEAGMVDSRVMGALLQHAEKAQARLVLIGDPAQLQAVGPGGVYRHLVAQAQQRGRAAELSEVRRQRESWQREAAEQIRQGEVGAALRAYLDRKRLHIAKSRDAAYQRTVDSWWSKYHPAKPGESLMLAGTRADVARLNHLARQKLHKAHQLTCEQSFQTRTRDDRLSAKIDLAEGDRIQFRKNDSKVISNPESGEAEPVRNGELATVRRLKLDNQGDLVVTAERDDGTILRWREQDYGQIQHGYASTTHAAQGASADHVAVLVSGALSREKTYVELSRQRLDVEVIMTERQVRNLADAEGAERESDPLAALKSTIHQMAESRPKETTLEYTDGATLAAQGNRPGRAKITCSQAEQQPPTQSPAAPGRRQDQQPEPDAIRQRPRDTTDWNELLKLRATANYFAPAGTAAPERAERGPAVADNPLLVRIANRWVWARKPEKTAITDHENFVAVNDPAPEAIRYALRLAAARWGKVSVRGTAEFRRTAWRQGALMGIELVGYSPDQSDRTWLQTQQSSVQRGEPAVPSETDGLRDEESPAPPSDSGPGPGNGP